MDRERPCASRVGHLASKVDQVGVRGGIREGKQGRRLEQQCERFVIVLFPVGFSAMVVKGKGSYRESPASASRSFFRTEGASVSALHAHRTSAPE